MRHIAYPSLLLAIALLAVAAPSCVDDPCRNVGGSNEGCAASGGGTRVDVTVVDTTPPTDTRPQIDTAPQPQPYRYVRINDLSPTSESTYGGADIDAVILDKPDGTQHFATTVEGFFHGGGQVEGTEVDPVDAVGAPDAFLDYATLSPVCDLESGYVSLGGLGGFVIVGMGGIIEPDDTITVLEIGGCTGNDGAEGINEEIQLQIAVGFQIDEQWVTIGQGEGPVLELPVPTLPAIPGG